MINDEFVQMLVHSLYLSLFGFEEGGAGHLSKERREWFHCCSMIMLNFSMFTHDLTI